MVGVQRSEWGGMDVGHVPTQGPPPPARPATASPRGASRSATAGWGRWASHASARLAGRSCPWPPPAGSSPWGDGCQGPAVPQSPVLTPQQLCASNVTRSVGKLVTSLERALRARCRPEKPARVLGSVVTGVLKVTVIILVKSLFHFAISYFAPLEGGQAKH